MRSGPEAWRGTGSADDLASGRDHLERHHHVLDLAVLRGEHARAAVREEAADRRTRDGGREVHGREEHRAISACVPALVPSVFPMFSLFFYI